jgi:SAM-dependent methyltransferase
MRCVKPRREAAQRRASCLRQLARAGIALGNSRPQHGGALRFQQGVRRLPGALQICYDTVMGATMGNNEPRAENRMKYRESDMPDERQWRGFFDPEKILRALDAGGKILLDIGCGYGTFLIPAAAMAEKVIGIDIEEAMIRACREKVRQNRLGNVELIQGDISRAPRSAADYICLFNILHCENPRALLAAARSLLAEKGRIGVIHWKRENTPRGPSMDIRPSPEDIILWAAGAGLAPLKQLDLPPYHFGLLFRQQESSGPGQAALPSSQPRPS